MTLELAFPKTKARMPEHRYNTRQGLVIARTLHLTLTFYFSPGNQQIQVPQVYTHE